MLILNADDWGRDRGNTDSILACYRQGALSSASAMVFMEDSERAAALAQEHGLDAGLHLNFTTAFTGANCPPRLAEEQGRLAKALRSNRLAQVWFHPGLARPFEYVVEAQLAEFARLYGAEAQRIDGHHHLHLCANVLRGRLLPAGTMVRRNFSFQAGEKSGANRLYRRMVDRQLAKRHRLTDYFFSIAPMEPERLERIGMLAKEAVVEVETHPVEPEEYALLHSGEIFSRMAGTPIVRGFRAPAGEPDAVVRGGAGAVRRV